MIPQEFVKRFSEFSLIEDRQLYTIGRSYFLVNEDLFQIQASNRIRPYYMGTYLGRDTNEGFIPSFFLLERIKKDSKKVMINEKAGWLFLCGRDVLTEGIIKKDDYKEMDYVLVLNEKKEVLGYGQWVRDGVHNILDRGDFLRRERTEPTHSTHARNFRR